VAFLSCCYRDQEFVRVGYDVSNEILGCSRRREKGKGGRGEGGREGRGRVWGREGGGGRGVKSLPPSAPWNVVPSEIMRNICADEPRGHQVCHQVGLSSRTGTGTGRGAGPGPRGCSSLGRWREEASGFVVTERGG